MDRHFEETIVAPNTAGVTATESSSPHIALVEGSTGPHFSRVTQSLLRSRLRVATIVMFGITSIFFVWHVLQYSDPTNGSEQSPFLLAYHAGLIVILGVSAYLLCPKCDVRRGVLRLQEVITFGLPALFLFLTQMQSNAILR